MMRDLILAHAARYPLMEAVDYAKFIYQSAFAGGHLIASPQAALERLKGEMDALQEEGFQPLTEPIGNGLNRLYLAPARRMGLRAETICALFVETAASFRPDPVRFECGMAELESLCREGALNADADEAAALCRAARESGYAPFSHSPRYREAYRPADDGAREVQPLQERYPEPDELSGDEESAQGDEDYDGQRHRGSPKRGARASRRARRTSRA